jgi:hypothetical protein
MNPTTTTKGKNTMKNLNNKKARERIAELYNIITVLDREIHDFLFGHRINSLEEHYRENGKKYYQAKTIYKQSIVELVEVYGIPHILYDDVIDDKKFEEAA